MNRYKIAAITLALFIIGFIGGYRLHANQLQATLALCTYAPTSQECGVAQLKTNTEYICNNAGNCWLEVN